MALTTQRDAEAVGAGFARWFAERHAATDVQVVRIEHPSTGFSSETLLVDLTWTTDGTLQSASRVIRMAPPVAGTFCDYDLVAQGEAQAAAAAVGLPVANPEVETDEAWLGAPFMVMDLIDGHIIGEVAQFDPWMRSLDEATRTTIHHNYIDAVASIHRADAGGLTAVPRRDLAAELDFWQRYLEWSSSGDPLPALTGALRWCRDHRPSREPDPVLLWGDVRFENMVFDDVGTVLAVLDWDMSSVGSPMHDLAWFTGLDQMMGHVFDQRMAGLPDRDATITLYEQSSGRTIDDIEWYETLALLRSTAIMTRIGYLRRDAGEPPMLPIDDNPILDYLTART